MEPALGRPRVPREAGHHLGFRGVGLRADGRRQDMSKVAKILRPKLLHVRRDDGSSTPSVAGTLMSDASNMRMAGAPLPTRCPTSGNRTATATRCRLPHRRARGARAWREPCKRCRPTCRAPQSRAIRHLSCTRCRRKRPHRNVTAPSALHRKRTTRFRCGDLWLRRGRLRSLSARAPPPSAAAAAPRSSRSMSESCPAMST